MRIETLEETNHEEELWRTAGGSRHPYSTSFSFLSFSSLASSALLLRRCVDPYCPPARNSFGTRLGLWGVL